MLSDIVESEFDLDSGFDDLQDGLGLLLNGQRHQEDWHEPVLTKRHSELRMPGHLEHEAAVPALVQQLVFRKPPDGQSA